MCAWTTSLWKRTDMRQQWWILQLCLQEWLPSVGEIMLWSVSSDHNSDLQNVQTNMKTMPVSSLVGRGCRMLIRSFLILDSKKLSEMRTMSWIELNIVSKCVIIELIAIVTMYNELTRSDTNNREVTRIDTMYHELTRGFLKSLEMKWCELTWSDPNLHEVTRCNSNWHEMARANNTKWPELTRSSTNWYKVTCVNTKWTELTRIDTKWR